jgi:hypothetical protein
MQLRLLSLPLPLPLLFAIGARAAFAQAHVVDEGTLVLTRGGAPLGTETFRLTTGNPGRPEVVRLTARVAAAEHQITCSLSADSSGTPLDYSVTAKSGGSQALDVKGSAMPRGFLFRSNDHQGNESTREFAVNAGSTIILDDDLYHQFALIALKPRPSGASLKVISPRSSRESTLTLAAAGLESIDVGGRSVTATRYVLSGGGTRREFWIDQKGRLLKVIDPERKVVAVREELPK